MIFIHYHPRRATKRNIIENNESPSLCACTINIGLVKYRFRKDQELAQNKKYANYIFCRKIEDNDIRFDYKIRQGRSEDHNTIALLHYLRYPDIHIGKAENYVLLFFEYYV